MKLLIKKLDNLIRDIKKYKDTDYHKRIEDKDYNNLVQEADKLSWVLNN